MNSMMTIELKRFLNRNILRTCTVRIPNWQSMLPKVTFSDMLFLYKTGGAYIDVDGAILRPLRNIISPDDVAIITRENVTDFLYVQRGLVYDKEHPFLKRALDKCMDNNNRFPHEAHRMTGPTAYTEAILECIKENSSIPHRVFGVDYNRKIKGVLIPKHFLYRILHLKHERWNKEQVKKSVLK